MNKLLIFSFPETKMLEQNELDSMIDCNTLYWIGIVHIFIFVGSIGCNSNIVWVYIHDKKKDSKSSIDLFVAVLAFLNFLGSLFELPFVMISQFHCKWAFTP